MTLLILSSRSKVVVKEISLVTIPPVFRFKSVVGKDGERKRW
jgi:hypothetical protein